MHETLSKTVDSSMLLLADPGEARGCSTNSFVIHKTDSFIHSLTDPLVKIFLWRRHALMVEDGAFSHIIDNVPIL